MSRYLLLDHTLPGAHTRNMLGRIVVEKEQQLWSFIPDTNEPSAREIVKSIGDDPVHYCDLARVFKKTRSSSTKARLTDLLEAHAESATSQNVEIKSAEVVRYEMINSGKRLIKLMENQGYKKQCLELLQQHPHKKLPMVTGVMTCKNTKVKLDKTNDQGGGMQARIPIGEATGTSRAADIQGNVDHNRNDADKFEVLIEEEVIFACAYDEVKLQKFLERRCIGGNFFSKRKELDEPTAVVTKRIKGKGIKLNFEGKESQRGESSEIGVGDLDIVSDGERSTTSHKSSFSLCMCHEEMN